MFVTVIRLEVLWKQLKVFIFMTFEAASSKKNILVQIFNHDRFLGSGLYEFNTKSLYQGHYFPYDNRFLVLVVVVVLGRDDKSRNIFCDFGGLSVWRSKCWRPAPEVQLLNCYNRSCRKNKKQHKTQHTTHNPHKPSTIEEGK